MGRMAGIKKLFAESAKHIISKHEENRRQNQGRATRKLSGF